MCGAPYVYEDYIAYEGPGGANLTAAEFINAWR